MDGQDNTRLFADERRDGRLSMMGRQFAIGREDGGLRACHRLLQFGGDARRGQRMRERGEAGIAGVQEWLQRQPAFAVGCEDDRETLGAHHCGKVLTTLDDVQKRARDLALDPVGCDLR